MALRRSLRSSLAAVATLATSLALAQGPAPDGGVPPPAEGDAAAPVEPGASDEPAPPPAESREPAPPASAEPGPSAAPPAASPSKAAPPVTPSVTPVVAPPRDTGAERGESANAEPPERALGIQIDAGYGRRLGDSNGYDLTQSESGGLVFGPSVWLSPARTWSIGLGFQRSSLGNDHGESGQTTVDIERRLDLFWLGGRAFPFRTDSFGVYLMLGLGAGWQHVNVSGTQETQSFVRPATAYVCSASSGPGFALGGGVGVYADIDRNFGFVTQLDTFAHRQTSDVIEDCAPGSGSVTTLGARIGFEYRFDLGAGDGAVKRGSSALLR
jgi:hypothetical protein